MASALVVIGAYGMPRQFQYYSRLFTVTFVVAFSIFFLFGNECSLSGGYNQKIKKITLF